jgi:hypothetical protein
VGIQYLFPVLLHQTDPSHQKHSREEARLKKLPKCVTFLLFLIYFATGSKTNSANSKRKTAAELLIFATKSSRAD